LAYFILFLLNCFQYAHTPGSPLLPDFFLDEYDEFVGSGGLSKSGKIGKSSEASGAGAGKVQEVFDRIGKHLNAELVGQAQALYQFNVSGAGPIQFVWGSK
jgi:hypothetical protein